MVNCMSGNLRQTWEVRENNEIEKVLKTKLKNVNKRGGGVFSELHNEQICFCEKGPMFSEGKRAIHNFATIGISASDKALFNLYR